MVSSAVIILLFFIQGFFNKVYCNDTLRLGTASKGGNYFRLGESIKLACQTKIEIEVIETDGSVDNIYKLQTGDIDIALVQNDISFFAENGLPPFAESLRGLTGIITFYEEPVFVVTNMPDIYHLDQLRNLAVNVGPLRSGLRADAKIILNSLGLWDSVMKIDYKPADVFDPLSDNELQAAFINNLTEGSLSLIKENRLFVIPFSNNLVDRLIQTYPYFKEFRTKVFDDDIVTVAVKSVLLCRQDLDRRIVYDLTEALYENFTELTFPGGVFSHRKDNVINSMSLSTWHEGARKYYTEIRVMESQTYMKILSVFIFIVAALLALFVILDILIFSFNRTNLKMISIHSRLLRFIKSINIKIIDHKYLTVFLFMLTAYLTDIVIVQNLEHDWAIKHNTVSNFDNRSFTKNLLWIFMFGASGYNDNLFPQSPLGKLFATLIPLIGIGTFLTIVGMIAGDHIKKNIQEARGVRTKMIKNHIIICGWNENVPFLVKNLLHENIVNKKPIIILAKVKEETPLDSFGIDNSMVGYVRGEATSKDDLKKANLKDADIAIIVSDSDSSDPDAKNILKILTVEKYCKELEDKAIRNKDKRENIYTIAEMQDADKFQAAFDAFVDEILSFGQIKSKMFVQSVLNPGVSTFFNQILTYNDFNDVYSFHIRGNGPLCNHTFDELLTELRKSNILLLSINIGYQREKKDLEKIKSNHNLTRTVLTNPFLKGEIEYRTHAGDILIVLAQYERDLKKALNKIEKSGVF